jgi:pyridoxal 5'-phosphate synthase pdxT subunit
MVLASTGLFDAVAERLSGGMPVLGTCAGLILLAQDVLDGRPDQRSFGVLDVTVRRNGYGRQMQSFERAVEFGEGPPLPTVFIRAPRVVSAGADVDVLAALAPDGDPVLVRQGAVLASCFHPELTPDRRVHRMFADMCRGAHEANGAAPIS